MVEKDFDLFIHLVVSSFPLDGKVKQDTVTWLRNSWKANDMDALKNYLRDADLSSQIVIPPMQVASLSPCKLMHYQRTCRKAAFYKDVCYDFYQKLVAI